MTDAELDERIRACAAQVRALCDEISKDEIAFPRAVALGLLLSCTAILSMLCTEPQPIEDSQLSLLEVLGLDMRERSS